MIAAVYDRYGPPKVRRLEVIDQLAEALKVMHLEALLHRNVNPNNVMVTNEGLAVLVDFGLGSSS